MWKAKKGGNPEFMTSPQKVFLFIFILQEDFDIEEEIMAAPQKDLEVA